MLFKPSLKTREVVLDTESFAVSVILTSSGKCLGFFCWFFFWSVVAQICFCF